MSSTILVPEALVRPKLSTLEYGRFIAASLVAFAPVASQVPALARPGMTLFGGVHGPSLAGADYFFTLTGFVLLTAHDADLGRLAALPRYLWRRFARIYPAFWLVLALPFALPHATLSPLQALGIITLASPDVTAFIGPAWSLRQELAFYLLFAGLLIPRIGDFMLVLWLAAITWLAVPPPLRQALNPPPLHALHAALTSQGALLFSASNYLFAAGLYAAWHYRRRQVPIGVCFALIVFAALCLVLAGPPGGWYQTTPRAFVYPEIALGFGSLILALANLERLGAIPPLPAAALLGNMAYPLFLLHAPLMQLATFICTGCLRLHPSDLYALYVVTVVSLYLLAAALALLFDQPLQRVLRRIV